MKNKNGWPAMRLLDAATIGEAVEACRRRLVGVSPTPWLDARILTGYVTNLDASAIVAYGDNRLDAKRRERLLELTARRAAGEPVAYLVGSKEFCGLRIDVDRRVLVPRSETEELVLEVVRDWRGREADILELGTGSGAIACALAHLLPRTHITATDLSAGAVELANRNISQLGFAERVELRAGDLFDALPAGRSYDVIVANLPYVAENDTQLDAAVRAHEPPAALFAGSDGLELYRRMFPAAPPRLRPRGALYCECGPQTAAGLGAIARAAFPNKQIATRRDSGGRERMIVVM